MPGELIQKVGGGGQSSAGSEHLDRPNVWALSVVRWIFLPMSFSTARCSEYPDMLERLLFSCIGSIEFLGMESQKKVTESYVVVIGLGGVGGHAASMLLRSGVGRLLLVDFDQDIGNLEIDPVEFARTLCDDLNITDPEVGTWGKHAEGKKQVIWGYKVC